MLCRVSVACLGTVEQDWGCDDVGCNGKRRGASGLRLATAYTRQGPVMGMGLQRESQEGKWEASAARGDGSRRPLHP